MLFCSNKGNNQYFRALYMGCQKLTYYPNFEVLKSGFAKELTSKKSVQNARTNYLYGFGSQERDNEISGKGNSYTAEFWQYSPRLGKRWNIDPVVKPHRSPYDVFSNNPIIRIDPNGADDYKVNRKGNFTLKKKTSDDFDKLIGRTQKGFRKSTQIEKGIMSSNSHHNVTLERNSPTEENKDNKETIDYKIDTYVGSAKETQKLFEFLGATTDVEWSLYKFNEGGVYPHSILTTSHDESTDVSGHIIINNPLFKESDFNGHDHIHPGGSKTPSGYYDSRELNPRGSGDVGFARTLITIFNGKELLFRIYTKPERGAKKGTYTKYDDTTIDDEGGIIIKPK